MSAATRAAQGAAPSLVGSSKSSTDPIWARIADLVYPDEAVERRHEENAAWLDAMEAERLERFQGPNLERAGRFVKLTSEPWRAIEQDPDSGRPYTPLGPATGRWKATLHTDTENRRQPPRQEGERWTQRLSKQGQQAIEDSAKYCWRMGWGYRTFLTLTFDQEARADIELHDRRSAWEVGRPHRNYHGPYIPNEHRKTIGRRVTELLNTLQQRYRNGKVFSGHYRRAGKQKRGGGYRADGEQFAGNVHTAAPSAKWTPIKYQAPFRLPPHNSGFRFAWVIEAPENEAGQINPHVHVLLSWGVKKHQFYAWAGWVEGVWGKGFAKLEKLRKPASAANYMAKAARYIGKGTEGSQGRVRGNRYGLATDGRAPPARHLGTYFADFLAEAVELLREASREKLPPGLWVHRWGFGANLAEGWGQIWQVLKADGWRWQAAPQTALTARVEAAIPRLLATEVGGFKPSSEYLDALLNGDEPAWVN